MDLIHCWQWFPSLRSSLTDNVEGAPCAWKLQVTEAVLLITSVDVNVHQSLASVPFSTVSTGGVYASTADTWAAKNTTSITLGHLGPYTTHNGLLVSYHGASITQPTTTGPRTNTMDHKYHTCMKKNLRLHRNV